MLSSLVKDLAEWTVLQLWLLYSMNPALLTILFMELLVGNFLSVVLKSVSFDLPMSILEGLDS